MTVIKVTPKTILALRILVNRSLNRLEALNLYGDTCLNSTVSELANRHGFNFIRKTEPHINRANGKSYFMRYWLEPSQMKKAYDFINNHSHDTDNKL